LRRRIGYRTIRVVLGGLQQRFQSLSRSWGKPAKDSGIEMPIMGMDRSTDDPIDTVGCWRFDRKLTTPRLDECGELIRNRSKGRYLISQPRLEQLGIGDGRLPEAKQGSNLRAMAFPGSACRVVPGGIIELHAKLSSDLLDNPLINV